jgi:hypothetical protein
MLFMCNWIIEKTARQLIFIIKTMVPDLEVKPTIRGIREGRDELLEKAIEFIRQE